MVPSYTQGGQPKFGWRIVRLVLVSLTFQRGDAFVPRTASTNELLPRQQHTTFLHAQSGTRKKRPRDNTLCVNRLAYRNYEVLDTLEAGIALRGTEVKSIRDGKMNLRDGYVRTKDGRTCVLYNVHIGKHTTAGAYFQHEERRPRTLLLHKEQARRLKQQTEQQGMTVVPLKAYLNDQNRVKLQIALCRGKNVRDKRQDIKEREAKREENRILKTFRVF